MSKQASQVIAERYAKALLGGISDPGVLRTVGEELRAVAKLIGDNPQFKAFLEGPNVPDDQKHAIIQKALTGKVEPVLMDFLRLLIDKHRVDQMGPVADAFQRLVEEQRNQLRAMVTTAVPLAPDAADRLKRALDTTTGKDAILETRVDPSIIAGVIVVFGDQVIDGSVRTALSDLRKELVEAPL